MLPFSDVCGIMINGDDFMKKICLILALILSCVVLLAACSKNTGTGDETSETQTESTTAKPLTAEEQKEVDMVEELVYNLAMATTADEVNACVVEGHGSDEYAEYVLGGFPDDDYIVEAQRLIEYKGTVVFNVIVTCESDPDYIYSGIQLFSYNDEGKLLINLDEDLTTDFCKEYACAVCEGKGYAIKLAETSGGYDEEVDCPACNGIGFVFIDEKVTE